MFPIARRALVRWTRRGVGAVTRLPARRMHALPVPACEGAPRREAGSAPRSCAAAAKPCGVLIRPAIARGSAFSTGSGLVVFGGAAKRRPSEHQLVNVSEPEIVGPRSPLPRGAGARTPSPIRAGRRSHVRRAMDEPRLRASGCPQERPNPNRRRQRGLHASRPR